MTHPAYVGPCGGTNQGRRVVKHIFHRPILPHGLYIQAGLFVRDTPAGCWEIIKRLAAYQRHGRICPIEVLSMLPPLAATDHGYCRFTLGFMAGQEYHCPHCLLSPCRELPGIDSALLIARCRKNQAKGRDRCWGLAAFFRQVIAQPLRWLAVLYRDNGKVFDEMGIRFSKSGACRQKRKQAEAVLSSSTCFLTKDRNCNPIHSKIFSVLLSPQIQTS